MSSVNVTPADGKVDRLDVKDAQIAVLTEQLADKQSEARDSTVNGLLAWQKVAAFQALVGLPNGPVYKVLAAVQAGRLSRNQAELVLAALSDGQPAAIPDLPESPFADDEVPAVTVVALQATIADLQDQVATLTTDRDAWLQDTLRSAAKGVPIHISTAERA